MLKREPALTQLLCHNILHDTVLLQSQWAMQVISGSMCETYLPSCSSGHPGLAQLIHRQQLLASLL
jgi:hypothetical protein